MARRNMTKRINDPIKKVIGIILISKAFKPSIDYGAGPLGA